MRGALTVDEPRGQRWDLALDLLSQGPDLVALGPRLLLNRNTAGPRADGQVHIGVVARANPVSREKAQSEVDDARALVQEIADEDETFGSLLRWFGVRWDYVEDSETAAITLAQVGEDGVLIWSGG